MEDSKLCTDGYKTLKDCRDFGFEDQMQLLVLSMINNLIKVYKQ